MAAKRSALTMYKLMQQKEFEAGLWYAIEQVTIFQNNAEMGIWLAQEASLSKEECLQLAKRSGYETDRMIKEVINRL